MEIPRVIRRSELQDQIGRHAVAKLIQTKQVTEVWPGVLVGRAYLLDHCARAEAALLHVGENAVLSGRSAAVLHGCSSGLTHDIEVTVPYHCHARSLPGLRVRRGRVDEDDVESVEGLQSQVIGAAVTEILCTCRRRDALAIADQAMRLRCGTDFRAELLERLDRRRDRRGTLQAYGLLDLVTGLSDSPPESWLKLDVVDAGFPMPTQQFEITDIDDLHRYFLDLAWPQLRIALEYDGYEAHEKRAAADAARDADLEGRGWIVIRVTKDDLANPSRWIGELLKAFRSRGVRELSIVLPR